MTINLLLVKRLMGFISGLLGAANKIGGLANKFVNAGGTIGKIATGIGNASKLVSSVIPRLNPIINGITTTAKLAYNTGLLDKVTNGKATRFVKGITNIISPNRGINSTSGEAVKAAGSDTITKQYARLM